MWYVINVLLLELKGHFCIAHVLSFKKTRQQTLRKLVFVSKQHCSSSSFPFWNLLIWFPGGYMLVQELTVEVYFPETGKLRKWDDGPPGWLCVGH